MTLSSFVGTRRQSSPIFFSPSLAFLVLLARSNCSSRQLTEAQEEERSRLRRDAAAVQVVRRRAEVHRLADHRQPLQGRPDRGRHEEVVEAALLPAGQGGDRQAPHAKEGPQGLRNSIFYVVAAG